MAEMSVGRIALVGDPVSGSVSPAMQNAAFRERGLPFEYEALRVPRGELPARFASLREQFAGLNVTIPHKEEAARLVDVVEPAARVSGSVNTVVFRNGRAFGDSTDGQGFLRALRRGAPDRELRSALIVGTGGAARAVAAALVGDGRSVRVTGRGADAAARLAHDIAGVETVRIEELDIVLDDTDLLVSAVPVQAWDDGSLPEVPLGPELVVFDLAYRPRRTPLLERAEAEGSTIIEGIEMLIEQGALSFLLWTGVDAPRAVMREAAYDALARAVVA
jgi:shikimate dehydrogenase